MRRRRRMLVLTEGQGLFQHFLWDNPQSLPKVYEVGTLVTFTLQIRQLEATSAPSRAVFPPKKPRVRTLFPTRLNGFSRRGSKAAGLPESICHDISVSPSWLRTGGMRGNRRGSSWLFHGFLRVQGWPLYSVSLQGASRTWTTCP